MSSSRQNDDRHSEQMVGNYRIGSEIGKGSFAVVYKGVHVKNKSLVAIKAVLRSKLNRKLLENLEAEIQILKNLHHPHIVALLDCQKSTRYIHLIMEYCSLGDLSQFIKRREKLHMMPATAEIARAYPNPPGGGLNEVICRHFLQQLASSLEFLRSKNLIHRDVKPQNLLLDPPPNYQLRPDDEGYGLSASHNLVGLPTLPCLKIADFGFARELQNASMAETLCGSPLYMAPEILRYEKYDAKADLWSVGTVLYEMVVGKPPFKAPNHVDLLKKIEQRNDRIDFPASCDASDDIRQLICALLKRSPVERISFSDFFNHIVVKGEIPGANGKSQPVEPVPETSAVQRRASSSEKRDLPSDRRPPGDRYSMERQRSHRNASPTIGLEDNPELPFARPGSAAPPHRPADYRRATTTQATQVKGQAVTSHPQPRPVMISHATSPARQEMLIGRAVSTPMERQISQKTSSPGSSTNVLQQQQQQLRERERKRAEHARDVYKDNAEQDVMFDRDYVIVEKRSVEVNALADELAASPRVTGRPPLSPSTSNALLPRRSHSGSSRHGNQRPSSSGKRPDTSPHSRSLDRRYASSPGSTATSALARALNMANFRLFGIGYSPPNNRYSPPSHSPFPTYPTSNYHGGSMVVVPNTANSAGGNPMDEYDTTTITAIEECASKSDVVFHFAAVKYSQLVPIAPIIPQGLGLLPASGNEGEYEDSNPPSDTDLTPEAVVCIAEHALVLYVKCLSLLAKAIDIVGAWWSVTNQRTSDAAIPQPNAQAAAKINAAVQWARQRFNETLEKAEYVRMKLIEAQLKLPASHPSHPANHVSNSSQSGSRSTSTAATVDKVYITPGVTAEKLMYDRAVEMSRGAAVNELVGEDLDGCHMSYVTAMKLMEAILEKDEGEGADNTIGDDDTHAVENLIAGLKSRIESIKKKMGQMSKRNSEFHSIPNSPIPTHSPLLSTPPR